MVVRSGTASRALLIVGHLSPTNRWVGSRSVSNRANSVLRFPTVNMKINCFISASFAICVFVVGMQGVLAQPKTATPDPYFGLQTSNSQRSEVGIGSGFSNPVSRIGVSDEPQERSSIVKQPQQSGSQLVGHSAPSPEPFQVGKVLALVGGEPIFVGDLMFQINQAIESRIPDAPEKIKEQQRQSAIPQLLPQFVQAKLLYMGALSELPEGVDLEQVFESVGKQFDEKALPKMMESAGVKNAVEFDAQLRGQNYSLRQLRRSWAIQQFTRHSVGLKLNNVSETTHHEMLERYQKNIRDYDQPARAKWEQVMVSYSKNATKDDARRKIVALGNKIVNGANLAATAKQDSDGFKASSGGQHDWTTKGALALKPLDKAIFELPLNQLSRVVETSQGLHIVRVLEREEATRKPFLEAQVEIKKVLEVEKREAAFKKYNEKLKREIPVEYLVNE